MSLQISFVAFNGRALLRNSRHNLDGKWPLTIVINNRSKHDKKNAFFLDFIAPYCVFSGRLIWCLHAFGHSKKVSSVCRFIMTSRLIQNDNYSMALIHKKVPYIFPPSNNTNYPILIYSFSGKHRGMKISLFSYSGDIWVYKGKPKIQSHKLSASFGSRFHEKILEIALVLLASW